MALTDLVQPRSREQVKSRLLTLLGGRDFPITNYHSGDPVRHLLEVVSESVADIERTIAALAAGEYLDLAAGEWLDLRVGDWNIARQPTVTARVGLTLTCAVGFGPYTVLPGLMWFSTPSGLRYSSATGGILAAGGTLSVEVLAESPGSAYNVPSGTINILNTPLPGVSASNPPGGVILAGADQESDVALRQRARLRWAELGGGATRKAYIFWALTSDPSVKQVQVLDEHPRGQGTVDVVLWGAGGLGSAAVAAANAYIQDRRPVTADVRVYSATERVLALPLTLFAPGADHASIEGQIVTNLAALQQATPIGGTLYRSAVIEQAMLPAGMIDARLSGTSFDALALGPTEAVTLNPTFTWSG
jgi:uncharacterized phage protein gp47/JayE